LKFYGQLIRTDPVKIDDLGHGADEILATRQRISIFE